MKKICIWLCVLVLTGCATTASPTKSFIDQAIWPDTTKNNVYTACLTALQMEGFDIHPLGTSKVSGIIITGQVGFYPFKDFTLVKGYYNLQILVSELKDNKVKLDVKVKASWKKIDPGAWGYNKNELQNRINNKVSEDLERLFTRLDILLGKAEYYRGDRVLEW